MKKSIVTFWLERRIRQIESDPVNHVALAQAGASYAERRAAEEAATKKAADHKVELVALRAAAKFLKEHAPEEMAEDTSE
jgi:hypothetical protein